MTATDALGLGRRAPGEPAKDRRRMAIKLELLAFSRKAAARYRDAGGPLGVVAGTLVSGTNGSKTTLGRKSYA